MVINGYPRLGALTLKLSSTLLNQSFFFHPRMPSPATATAISYPLGGPCRIAILLRTNNIPGDPQSRQITVATAFLNQFFNRNWDQANDFVHTPCEIDKPKTRCVLLLDIDAGTHKGLCPDEVPLHCFRVEYHGPVA